MYRKLTAIEILGKLFDGAQRGQVQ